MGGGQQPVFSGGGGEGIKDVSAVKPPSVSSQSSSLFGKLLTMIMAPFA